MSRQAWNPEKWAGVSCLAILIGMGTVYSRAEIIAALKMLLITIFPAVCVIIWWSVWLGLIWFVLLRIFRQVALIPAVRKGVQLAVKRKGASAWKT